MKICFGIVSWLPKEQDARKMRIDRLNRLLKQLEEYWPDIPILIVAQDWNDYQPNTTSPLFIQKYSRLGILKARQTLREWFLSLDYDYIIMFDDDAIIQVDNDHAHLDYIKCIEDHPDGFAFIHGKGSCAYTPYADSQLNLCAISKKIYTEVPMPQADPQLSQAFEDRLFSTYLHFAYMKDEFEFPNTIRCIHFKNKDEVAPSTWSREKKYNWNRMRLNTRLIEDYIATYKKMPNLKRYF